jgi:DnaJ-class molecular chaperone
MQEPESRPAKAITVVPQPCMWCFGTGHVPNDHHECYDRCESCNGSGVRPNPHLHDAPALPMVAAAA